MKAYKYDWKSSILVETDQGLQKAKGKGVPAFFPLGGTAFYRKRQKIVAWRVYGLYFFKQAAPDFYMFLF